MPVDAGGADTGSKSRLSQHWTPYHRGIEQLGAQYSSKDQIGSDWAEQLHLYLGSAPTLVDATSAPPPVQMGFERTLPLPSFPGSFPAELIIRIITLGGESPAPAMPQPRDNGPRRSTPSAESALTGVLSRVQDMAGDRRA